MYFAYIVLNQKNQKVEGKISAETVEEARERLHALGFSILSIEEVEEGTDANEAEKNLEKPVLGNKFYFSYGFKALDKQGKEILGTIDAEDAFAAYRRLIEEFKFEVKYLFDVDADLEIQNQQKTDLVKKMEQQYQLFKKEQPAKAETGEEKITELERRNVEKLNFLRNQVDIILIQMKEILKKAKDDPQKNSQIYELKSLMGELARIKMSNNIKHIRKLAERTLDLAEKIFQNRGEYQIVLAQKNNLKEGEEQDDKISQMLYREAIEANYLGKVFGKINSLLGNYSHKNQDDNYVIKTPRILPRISREELLPKTFEELRANYKQQLKILLTSRFFFSIRGWNNLFLSWSIYWNRLKEMKKGKGKKEISFLERILTFLVKKNQFVENPEPLVLKEINMFLSWILCFYLIFYVWGGLMLEKNIFFLKTFFYKTITSEFLLFFIFFVFMFNFLIHLKISFLRKSRLASFLIFSFGLFSVILFGVNY